MKHLLFACLLTCLSLNLLAQSFTTTLDEPHYFLLLPSPITDMDELGAAIAKHNYEYYPQKDLKVSTASMNLGENTIFYYVPGFDDKSTALDYYHSLAQHQSDIIADENTSYYFIISKSNLNEVLKAKSLQAYKSFFAAEYL